MMKIAVLGGTFNPIHLGHIAMAEYVAGQMGFDKICFLPNGQPPHKTADGIADKFHRLEMVKLATQDNDKFYVSDYEINRDKHCYTVDTVKYFNSLDDNEYHFIIGADSLFMLDTWKNSQELKKICSFIICDREGNKNTNAEIARHKATGCRMVKADMPLINITSTDIRNMIKNGESIDKYVPTPVADYILKYNLYK